MRHYGLPGIGWKLADHQRHVHIEACKGFRGCSKCSERIWKPVGVKLTSQGVDKEAAAPANDDDPSSPLLQAFGELPAQGLLKA